MSGVGSPVATTLDHVTTLRVRGPEGGRQRCVVKVPKSIGCPNPPPPHTHSGWLFSTLGGLFWKRPEICLRCIFMEMQHLIKLIIPIQKLTVSASVETNRAAPSATFSGAPGSAVRCPRCDSRGGAGEMSLATLSQWLFPTPGPPSGREPRLAWPLRGSSPAFSDLLWQARQPGLLLGLRQGLTLQLRLTCSSLCGAALPQPPGMNATPVLSHVRALPQRLLNYSYAFTTHRLTKIRASPTGLGPTTQGTPARHHDSLSHLQDLLVYLAVSQHPFLKARSFLNNI